MQDVAVGGADGPPPVVQRSAGTDALAAPSRPPPFARGGAKSSTSHLSTAVHVSRRLLLETSGLAGPRQVCIRSDHTKYSKTSRSHWPSYAFLRKAGPL